MTRLLSLIVGITFAVLLGACSPEDPFSPTRIIDTNLPHPAFLRIIHAAADAPPAGAMLGGRTFTGELPFMTFRTGVNEGKYYPADTSLKSIAFVAGGRTLASSAIDLDEGQFYTAYLYGKSPEYRVLITTDTVKPAPPSVVLKIRVVNLSPGAPGLDMTLTTSPNDPVTTNLQYGEASPYSTRTSRDFERPGITVVASGTTDTVMRYPADKLPLFGGAILTLVVSGEVVPSGSAPLLSFSMFIESAYDPVSQRYGSLPFPLSLVAIRMINLVPTPTHVGLDLAIFDRAFDLNEGYRRNHTGQDSVKNVPTLTDSVHAARGYFLFGALLPGYKYRVERTTVIGYSGAAQPPITRPDSLHVQFNQRYTVVVYGSNVDLEARTAELHDNAEAPTSSANARVRFFHGAYQTFDTRRLRLRAGGPPGPLMNYGQAPTAQDAFEIPAGGDVLLEVIDESGTVVYSSPEAIVGGKVYTIFLSPRNDGAGNVAGVMLRPVIDELSR